MGASLMEQVVRLAGAERVHQVLTEDERLALQYVWSAWARPEQLAPLDWAWGWLILAGRGYGKTHTGAETTMEEVKAGRAREIGLVAPTAGDARDILIEGPAGILALSPPWDRPEYEPSKRKLTWKNGAIAHTYSADEPERLRGKQHDFMWWDEGAAYHDAQATWDMGMFGLRLGTNPRWVMTTTPKPLKLIRGLIKNAAVRTTRGSTYDNASNLAPSFLEQIRTTYEGTRLGRQELYAEVLDDVPGALWTRANIDECRVKKAPEMKRVVVSIDPAVTSKEDSDETGIMVGGKGVDGHGYALADLSCRMSPDGWARRAVAAYYKYEADLIIAEVNNGGDLVEATIRTVDKNVPFKAVRASRGKMVRAEPVAALGEQKRIHHVGEFNELEDQQCLYTPDGFDGSPDRVDAYVWLFTELMLGSAFWIA